MIKNTHPGLFIAFEGLDGSGSEFFAAKLSEILAKSGYRICITKEPTNNLVGGIIRAQLTGEWKTNSEALQLLFAADRSHHLKTEIIPSLNMCKVVISDRYVFSSIAYGSQDIDDESWLERINARFILPDIIFLIKVSPKLCALQAKKSHYEIELFKKTEELEKVWKIYQKLGKKYPNVFVINGEQKENKAMEDIFKIVKKKLGGLDTKSIVM